MKSIKTSKKKLAANKLLSRRTFKKNIFSKFLFVMRDLWSHSLRKADLWSFTEQGNMCLMANMLIYGQTTNCSAARETRCKSGPLQTIASRGSALLKGQGLAASIKTSFLCMLPPQCLFLTIFFNILNKKKSASNPKRFFQGKKTCVFEVFEKQHIFQGENKLAIVLARNPIMKLWSHNRGPPLFSDSLWVSLIFNFLFDFQPFDAFLFVLYFFIKKIPFWLFLFS